MDDHRREAPGESPDPVPRDLPDQQAGAGEEDPWEVPVKPPADDEEAEDVPDTDEAGTGRQGTPQPSGTARSEHPTPQEPPA
ncbi:hypothetical protein [Streptomyces sp. NPDC093568]|uniref:hypothetical protein n=1 Tax=Streptomyces sp. NPDC093568 TaxID=3366041 RepID=UPI00381CBBD6